MIEIVKYPKIIKSSKILTASPRKCQYAQTTRLSPLPRVVYLTIALPRVKLPYQVSDALIGQRVKSNNFIG